MAVEPSLGARKAPLFLSTSFSDSRSAYSQLSNSLEDDYGRTSKFSGVIEEIKRVRSRFENERTQSDQFSHQMKLLSEQIDSLAGQRTSMLGFQIERLDAMLKELKTSNSTVEKEEQRARYEAELRAKFEREKVDRERRENEAREQLERERREQLQRERHEQEEQLQREREERERKEMIEKLEREHREREQREQDERERREREHLEKLKKLQESVLPSASANELIPSPTRTVSAPKRKLSINQVHTSVAHLNDVNALHPADSASNEPHTKRQRTEEKPTPLKLPALEISGSALAGKNEEAMSDTEDMKMSDDAPSLEASDSTLPPEVQESLMQQAMAMLQAQIESGASADDSALPAAMMSLEGQNITTQAMTPLDLAEMPPLTMDTRGLGAHIGGEAIKSELSAAPNPMPNASTPMTDVKGTHTAAGAVAKMEPATNPKATPSKVKPEPKPASTKKPEPASSKKARRPSKVVTPAVEDTTIADPMSVPLKNKAIHQWMSKDPERLYTADDICKAGIRYRARKRVASRSIESGKVYILTDLKEIRKNLCHRDTRDILWKCEGKNKENKTQWKVLSA